MDKARIAEWLLKRVYTPKRASEIVGDLLELRTGSTHIFWWSILCIVIAARRRWILAVCVALPAFVPAIQIFLRCIAPHASPLPRNVPWAAYAFALMVSSIFFFTAGVLNAVRFGFRNTPSCVAIFLSMLLILCGFITRLPHSNYRITGVCAFAAVMLVVVPRTRRSLVLVVGTASAQASVYFLGEALAWSLQPPSVSVAIGMWIVSVFFAAWVLGRGHRYLFDRI